tara:strand:+ start:476 stop:631 length:156 start_codon:yes stop_codon:yes gene_type:complete
MEIEANDFKDLTALVNSKNKKKKNKESIQKKAYPVFQSEYIKAIEPEFNKS